MNLSELRQKYPDYNDMSDQEFADAFHGKFYSDIPKEEFYSKIGFSNKAPVEKPKESKRKTTALEDIKLGLFNATKTAGLGFGGLVAPLLPDNQGDAFLDKLHGGVAAMEAWANPNMAEQTFGGKLLGNVATLPAQFAAMPFSPVSTGQDFLDKGESLPRAQAAGAIDTVGNVFGAAMPVLGSSLPMKAATTFSGNALQEFVSKSLTQSVAKNNETKEAYKPTFEDAVLAGVTGLPMLAIPSEKKKVADTPSDKAKAVEADLTPSESIPKPPETIYTDSNGVSRFTPPDAGDWEPDGAYDSAYRPVPASQRGGIDLHGVIDGARDLLNKLLGIKPNDPEALAAKATADNIAKKARVNAVLGSESGYLENVTTPEAVIALAPNAKDIPRSAAIGGKTVTPGINALAVKHPNPLVKFMRAQTREVFVKTDALVEQYITGRNGIGSVIREMSNKEKAEVVQLLQLGDRKQTKITSELMDKHGYSEAQKEFVRKFYEMDAEKLRVWNEKRAEAGMEPVAAREGHVPGIFRGDYKQLVLNAEGKPLGVIAVDFKWQLKAAQEAMSKKFPDAKYTPVKRSSLGGSSGRTGEFGAMQEVLTMLAEKDPSFREVQDLISAAIAENSDKAYGAAQHALRKKGIVGNEGNKPWLDAEQNGADFIKSYLQHWEDQMISHAALPVEKQVRALMDNEALDSMPNAKDYVDDYLKGMTGRSVGETGRALNVILDAPAKTFGVGPSGTRAMVHQFNKRMGQYSMGFGNWLFSVTQWLQVAQTGVPEITSAAKQLGVSQAAVIPAMAKAVKDWMAAGTGETKGDFATSMKEARERGLLTFSEFTDVNKITQNKYSSMADKVIDFNRAELGENPTRPLVFFTAVNVLKEAGLTGKQLYDAAYNVTQAGMFDYRMNERPAMYQKMGLAGTLAGGLQTFKHGYMNQMQRMISNGGKDPVSAAYAATALLAYAGIGGMPFYQEADSMFKYITGKFGKEQTISEYALKEVPRWLEKGVISDVTNVNMQSRLSSADVLPNSPIEALSPYFSSIGRMGAAAKDVLSFNDQLAWKNMGVTMTPQGPLKGLAEKSLLTDDEGYVLNREGLRGNTRTQWDKDVRTFSGGRSLDEAMTGENQYNSGQRLKNYRDKQKSIMEQIQRKYVQGELTTEDMQGFTKKYTEAKGDPKQLATQLITFAKTTKLDKQQRMQGIPKSGNLSSLYKFQEYQDDVVKP